MLSKMEKRKGWGGGEKSSLESTSAVSGGGLWPLASGVWGVGGDGGGGLLHVWQYTECPCCKHEGRLLFFFCFFF